MLPQWPLDICTGQNVLTCRLHPSEKFMNGTITLKEMAYFKRSAIFFKIMKFLISRIFQRKISANRMALVGMEGGRAASTIWLKFCFLTITQMFLNGIDWYMEH